MGHICKNFIVGFELRSMPRHINIVRFSFSSSLPRRVLTYFFFLRPLMAPEFWLSTLLHSCQALKMYVAYPFPDTCGTCSLPMPFLFCLTQRFTPSHTYTHVRRHSRTCTPTQVEFQARKSERSLPLSLGEDSLHSAHYSV